MNPFNVGDIVATTPAMATQRAGGRVKYIACYAATGKGGATCNKKTCSHLSTNDYVWVEWPNGAGTFSYIYGELMLDLTFYNSSAQPTATSPANGGASALDTDDLAVPVKGKSSSTDEIIKSFKKGIEDLHIDKERIPKDEKFNWEKYNGFDKTGRTAKPKF